MHHRYLAALLLPGLLLACDTGLHYQEEHAIPEDSGWTYADSLSFSFDIADTLALYDLILVVDHRTGYPYQNLYTRIHTIFPSGRRLSQVLSLELMDKVGYWQGDCRGERCSLRIPIQESAYFNETGTYSLRLEQYMRRDSLPGLDALSLEVRSTGEKRSLQ